MNCLICSEEECQPDCPMHMRNVRGLDDISILRWNWQNGGAPIIMADPPYLAKEVSAGACEAIRENCEGFERLSLWEAQDPLTLKIISMQVCPTCQFELELIRVQIEELILL
jgi:hypothetical protein